MLELDVGLRGRYHSEASSPVFCLRVSVFWPSARGERPGDSTQPAVPSAALASSLAAVSGSL